MRIKCDICGKEFEGFGNNPAPLDGNVCCDECNAIYVIPARLKKLNINKTLGDASIETPQITELRKRVGYLLSEEVRAIDDYDEALKTANLSEEQRKTLEEIRNDEIDHTNKLNEIYKGLMTGAVEGDLTEDASNLKESFAGGYDPTTVNTELETEPNVEESGVQDGLIETVSNAVEKIGNLSTAAEDDEQDVQETLKENEISSSVTDAKMTVDRMIQIITPIVSDYAKKKGVEDYWKIHKNGKNVSVGMELGYRDMDKLCDILNAKLAPLTDSYFEPADSGLIETTVFDSAVELDDGYLGLSSSQECELKRYAERFGYDMREVYDGLNSRVSREGMSLQKAIEDIENKMAAKKSLYDSAIRDSFVGDPSKLKKGEYYHTQDYMYKYIGESGQLYDFQELEIDDNGNIKKIGYGPTKLTYNEVKYKLKTGLADSSIKDKTITKTVNLGRYNRYDTLVMKKANDYGLKLWGEKNVAEVTGRPEDIKLFVDFLNNHHSAGARITDSDTVNDIGEITVGSKYRFEEKYGNQPLTVTELGETVKLSLDNSKTYLRIPREKFEDMVKTGRLDNTDTTTIEQYGAVKAGDRRIGDFKSDELINEIRTAFNKLGKDKIQQYADQLKAQGGYKDFGIRLVWDLLRATISYKVRSDWYDKYDVSDSNITNAGKTALKRLGISL